MISTYFSTERNVKLLLTSGKLVQTSSHKDSFI